MSFDETRRWVVKCTSANAYFAADGVGLEFRLSKSMHFPRDKAHAAAKEGCNCGSRAVVVRTRKRTK